MDLHRPKSAPPENFRIGYPLARFSGDDDVVKTKKIGHTLEDRMNRFRTTERMLHRMKVRRRTEADIVVNETPAGLLAMEHPTKKISQVELENVVARVCRPTAAYSARVSSNRRINSKDIYVPPKMVRIEYFSIEHERFKGTRSLSNKAVKDLVARLSSYDAERRPPESKRNQTPEVRQRLGSVASYRWQGLKNC